MKQAALIRPLETFVYGLLAFAIAGYFLYTFYFDPVVYTALITEDKWCEYGTPAAFGLAGVVLVLLAVSRQNSRWQRMSRAVMGVAAIVIAGEEVSWGQRMLSVETPDALREVNLQGEITLHNLEAVAFLNERSHMLASVLVLAGLAVSVVIRWRMPRLQAKLDAMGLPLIPIHLIPVFLLTPFFLLVYPTAKADEVGEFCLGLAVLIWAVDLAWGYVKPSSATNPIKVGKAGAVLAALALAGSLSATLTLVHADGVTPMYGRRLNLMAATEYPARGLYAQSEQLYQYIYAHPQYLNHNTRIYHGQVLLQASKPAEAVEVLLQARAQLEAQNVPESERNQQQEQFAAISMLLKEASLAQAQPKQGVEVN